MSGQAAVQTQMAAKPTITPLTGHVLQRQCACGQHTVAGGECAECRKKREGGMLQRAAVGHDAMGDVPPIVHEVLRSAGQPLDAATRVFMEPRFGHDFSTVQLRVAPGLARTGLALGAPGNAFEREAERVGASVGQKHIPDTRGGYDFGAVRLHTDVRAAESARAVNALAYTVGSHIVFGSGQYAPGTNGGRQLLAHELTHVAQQGAGAMTSAAALRSIDPSAHLETEAQAAEKTIHSTTATYTCLSGQAPDQPMTIQGRTPAGSQGQPPQRGAGAKP
jgi:hypothetical protein